MFWFILSIAIGMFLSILSFYAFDNGYLWEKEMDMSAAGLRMPSVDDINTHDMDAIKEYVRNEIIPATRYFTLLDEYELRTRQEYSFLYVIAINFPLFLLAVTHAREFIPLENALLVPAVLALFALEIVVASVLYEQRFSIDKFSLDDAKIAKIKGELECEGIADYNALNNRLIQIRLGYLFYHAKEIKYRLFARKLIVFIGSLSFLLFMPMPG